MIPKEITNDLKNGLTLEDTLIKHGTNLHILFSGKKPNPYPEWMNIRTTKYNTYRVSKTINRKKIEYGTYKSYEDALHVRNELIKNNWDKTLLPEICKKLNITPNPHGGHPK